MKPSELNDDLTLTGVTEHGRALRFYDDGFGRLFVHRNSMGISGVVRARTWEDAYGICEDEFFPEADETAEELRKEYNFTRHHVKRVTENGVERDEVESDYAAGRLCPGVAFARWETRETPAPDGEDVWTENELFCEAYGFRPSGPRTGDVHGHGIYAKDLNGDSLDSLTDALAAELGIELSAELA